jgi:hypothetical protein
VLVFDVAVRQDNSTPEAGDDPNAKHIYAFFFRQKRYPATHHPIQLGLPTPGPTIFSKHPHFYTYQRRLGDHKERPDSRVGLST